MARWRLAAAIALVAAALPAGAQPSVHAGSVIVDWGAFDALGPAQAAKGAIVLHRPPARRVAVAAPAAAGAARAAAPTPAKKPPGPSGPIMATITPPQPPRGATAVTPVTAPALTPAPPPPNHVSAVRFTVGCADLPTDGRAVLDGVAAALAGNPALRLQLVGYASPGDDAIAARRIALKRAIEARTYLIGRGVQSVRMDVRALSASNSGAAPPDRVDVVIVDH
jgi:outer membrane protein OmpA-like peptidoglycan-associated protein